MRTLGELVHALERDRIPHVVQRAGSAWMAATPSLGARIIGAGVDEENLLWTAEHFSTAGWAHGGNAGGARTWIAPEGGGRGFFCSTDISRWAVPHEIDPGDYASCPAEQGWLSFRSAFTATAADGASFPLEITRSMRMGPVDAGGSADSLRAARISFRHEIRNRGSTSIDGRVGLWCVVQVPSEAPATIIIPVKGGTTPGCVRPYFVRLPDGILRVSDNLVLLKAHGGLKYKIGVHASAATGRMSFVRPSRALSRWTALSLSFPVDPRGAYLDEPWFGPGSGSGEGDAVQAYNDAGTGECAFSEIEVHAPAARLEPGEPQSFEIAMTLIVGPAPQVIDSVRSDGSPGITLEKLFSG